MLQPRRVCTTCVRAQHTNPNLQTVCYKFMGHNARYITRELSTFFDACFDKTFSHLHGWQAFPAHFRVCDFLLQQYRVLQFDNQLHVSLWNLVHVVSHTSADQSPVYEILDRNSCMNSISPHVLQQLEIHAVDLRLHAHHYCAERRHITYTEAPGTAGRADSVVAHSAVTRIEMIFRGHGEHNVEQITSSPVSIDLETPVSVSMKKFHENLRVCDFLQIVSEKIGRSNQLHVSQWNLVHVSAFTYPNHDQIYKILDHHLYMNNIPHAFLHHLEIHATSVVRRARFYLETAVSNEFPAYFAEQTPPTILYHAIQHPYGPPDNEHYYREQTGGHGLFGCTGAEYNQHGEYTGRHFSKYVQDHPLSNHR